MIRERYDLVAGRIKEIPKEETVNEIYRCFFADVANFILMLHELKEEIDSGRYYEKNLNELKMWNQRLYEDILPEHYEKSYANPSYAVSIFGEEVGQVLSFLYTELRGAIVYVFEKKEEYLAVLFELFVEIYNVFEENEVPDTKIIKEIIYWFASDYCDVFVADRIQEQVDPDCSFATDIICKSDLNDLRYLYWFGEYISENEWKTAEYFCKLEEKKIQEMADVYTEGYRIGFIITGKDLSKKSTVCLQYVLGFEKMIKCAIENFKAIGLKPIVYRSPVSALTKRQHHKTGYYGGIANKQYEYDHKDDQALFLNKRYAERKLEVMRCAFENYKEQAAGYAGPAVVEVFGEEPFSPLQKEEVVSISKRQEEIQLFFNRKSSQLTNEYIPGEERSYTIIAYPVPEIGEKYEEIFEETIKINTLDAKLYTKIQQTLIDALDQGEYVKILGTNGNRTDLSVQLWKLNNPEKETIFENCVADVNIPVGEVFTSPVLEGTNGVLHVKKVYLDALQYDDLELTFSNGMIADYRCGNFERESDGKKYVSDTILHKHPTLPLGEFAIGTNTMAYVMAKKYNIEDKMPVLIAEKTGPHFAVGDTCYNWCEDVRVYNPNGKEIVAKENSVSAQRKENVDKAYYQCHTDITIPYDELGSITVVTKEGEEIVLLENGRFVLPGTEILNEPLNNR